MSTNNIQWLDNSAEKASLEKMLQYFSTFSGLKAKLVDDRGITLVSTENRVPDCRFCKLIKSDPEGKRKCHRSYARANREAAKYGEPYVFRCHAGLVAWAVPIMIREHRCAIVCGQVLMWEIEDYFLDEITMMVNGLDVDISAVKQAALELNYLSGDKVQAISELLFVVANQIMNNEESVFSEQKNIFDYQAALSESISERKKLQSVPEVHYSHAKDIERDLIARIRGGDTDAAGKNIDNLLA